jgi:hypothetical protein
MHPNQPVDAEPAAQLVVVIAGRSDHSRDEWFQPLSAGVVKIVIPATREGSKN